MDNSFVKSLKWYDIKKYLPGSDGTYWVICVIDNLYPIVMELSYTPDGYTDCDEVFIRVPEQEEFENGKLIHVEDRIGKPTFYVDTYYEAYDENDYDPSCVKFKESILYEIVDRNNMIFWTPKPTFDIRDGKLVDTTSEWFDEDDLIDLS